MTVTSAGRVNRAADQTPVAEVSDIASQLLGIPDRYFEDDAAEGFTDRDVREALVC
jgi:hypothetical protein